jgi:ComF family protein
MGVGGVHYICDTCWEQIEFLSTPWCGLCGTPLNFSVSNPSDVCADCRKQPPRYGKRRAIAFYEPTVREAIHLFKYDKKRILAKHLNQLLQEHLPADLSATDYDFLLPIPLHTRRHRDRGFNQSEWIAQSIAEIWNVPVRTDILFRIKDTAPQSSMNSREERMKNIADAFEVPSLATISNQRILLVDDIYTTGTTVDEASKVLLTGNPAEVDVLTLARTRPTGH